MLSYQHGFHAGNFADVHKHLVFSLVLDYLVQKTGPITVLDVFAGRGEYRLDSAEARKTGEAEQGIRHCWASRPWPAVASAYEQAILASNESRALERYPGSPALARHWLRRGDRHILCELHPAEFDALQRRFGREAGCELHHRDALEALVALTPPQPRRGCVLVDPAYEVKSEYQSVPRAVREGLCRWPEATWLVWYPLLPGDPARVLRQKLSGQGKRGWLRSEVAVRAPGAGMHGSGMMVINPPWSLARQLEEAAAWLAMLGTDSPARPFLEVESTS